MFTLASLACVLSDLLATLTLMRALQGIGAAGIMSVADKIRIGKSRRGMGEFHLYCQRGEAENRIKETQLDLFAEPR